ncbi:HD domain-containing protein [Brevibacillus laterosporus]|nr:HD domain-containing protein [Brevibacillus laterosporus]
MWEEFEQRSTPEARFAATLDRFQPLLFTRRGQQGNQSHYKGSSD